MNYDISSSNFKASKLYSVEEKEKMFICVENKPYGLQKHKKTHIVNVSLFSLILIVHPKD